MVEQVAARYRAPFPVALMLCGLLTACGDRIPAPPGAPGTASPTPPASNPSPGTSAGFLHVLQHPWVMTYEIDPTGRLRPPVTQRIGSDLNLLAGEPQGRFVYGARGGWSLSGGGEEGSDLTIVAYSTEPRDGTLAPVSEVTVEPRPGSCSCDVNRGAWLWLTAGENRVHGLWQHQWGGAGHIFTYTYVSAAVAADGQLGPVSRRTFDHDDDGEVLVDVRSQALYNEGNPNYSDPNARHGGIEAYVIQGDGTLDRMGWSGLCLADEMHDSTPLVAAHGFLFTSSWNGAPTVCAYQGLRLKPLYALDLPASVADAFVPSSEDQPALVAMGLRTLTGSDYRSELRVFSMNSDGDLRQMYAQEVPDYIERLLFHPSGRSLYTVDRIAGLRVYTIDPQGRIELAMNIEHGGGSMAITLKDAQAEDP